MKSYVNKIWLCITVANCFSNYPQVACFNMGSILIKPVQRILRYPLLLNELLKCTEAEHADRADLARARDIMTDVAAFINESKRRKDIGMYTHYDL